MRQWITLVEAYEATTGAASEAAMADLLSPAGQSAAMGAEKGRLKPDGVSRLTNAYGATRYLYCEAGHPIAVLQIVSRDGSTGLIANVYTAPEARRRGIASRLMNRARRDFAEIIHNDDLTADGAAWANSVG